MGYRELDLHSHPECESTVLYHGRRKSKMKGSRRRRTNVINKAYQASLIGNETILSVQLVLESKKLGQFQSSRYSSFSLPVPLVWYLPFETWYENHFTMTSTGANCPSFQVVTDACSLHPSTLSLPTTLTSLQHLLSLILKHERLLQFCLILRKFFLPGRGHPH